MEAPGEPWSLNSASSPVPAAVRHSAPVHHDARLPSLDVMRGIAVILMAFGHCLVWGQYGVISDVYLAFTGPLTALRMPVLFIISGLLCANLLDKGIRKAATRAYNILWIFALWLPLNLYAEISVPRILQNFVLPETILWFLWCLAIYTIFIPVLNRNRRHLILGVTLVISSVSFMTETMPFAISNLLRYSCFFYAGALFKKEIVSTLEKTFSLTFLLMLVLITSFVHIVAHGIHLTLQMNVLQSVERFVVCALALYCSRSIGDIPVLSIFLKWVGRNTLPIYVSQLPALMIVREVINEWSGHSNMIAPLTLTITSISLSLLLYLASKTLRLNWLYKAPNLKPVKL